MGNDVLNRSKIKMSLRRSEGVLFFIRKNCRTSSKTVQNINAEKIFLNPFI